MSTRDLTAGRTREANTITAVLAVPCGLACVGSVLPGLDEAVTVVFLAFSALALAVVGLRCTTRWVRERAEDRADAHTAAAWRAEHAPHLLTATDRVVPTPASLMATTGWGWL
jgi:hypothetical protein